MKNFLKSVIFLTLISVMISCSSNSAEEEILDPVFSYSIETLPVVMQFEDTPFRIKASPESMNNINYVEWNIDGEIVNGTTVTKAFNSYGSNLMRATVYGNNGSSYNVSLSFDVTEEAHDIVTLKEVTITSIGSYLWNKFRYGYNNNDVSLRSHFEITELNLDTFQPMIMYISDYNDANNHQYSYAWNFEDITWNVSAANYRVKVYESGGYDPNSSINSGEFTLYFYGQNTEIPKPMEDLGFKRISFYEYRHLKPAQIVVNMNPYNIGGSNVTFILKLQWN